MKSYSDLQIVAIIPARGGSKGLPRKNILPLGGKPLIAHSIEDVHESLHCKHVYVSTDNEEISEISYRSGAEVIHRPKELANDTASSEAALKHTIAQLGSKGIHPDLIVFLQCTSPIRTGKDIDKAIEVLIGNESDSLLSVSPSHRFLWETTDGEASSINYDYRKRQRRQDMNPQYVENGSIYIFKPWVINKLNNRLGGKVSLYQMSEEASHEIDSMFDFQLAEFLLSQKVNVNAY